MNLKQQDLLFFYYQKEHLLQEGARERCSKVKLNSLSHNP